MDAQSSTDLINVLRDIRDALQGIQKNTKPVVITSAINVPHSHTFHCEGRCGAGIP